MRTMRGALLVATCALAAACPPAAGAASGPGWSLTITPLPSNLAPGASPEPQYLVAATNVGDTPSAGTAWW